MVEALGALGEVTLAADADLGDVIAREGRAVSGVVLFHLTPVARRFLELVRNERFCHPLTPVAYLGAMTPDLVLPFGTRAFGPGEHGALDAYLAAPLERSVLVVEDDEGIRDVLDLTLSKHFRVDLAEDGDVAHRTLERTRYDAVVLDVMLPGRDGETLMRYLRATHPATPVIVITAYDSPSRELCFVLEGAAAYLTKPFRANRDVRRTVLRALVEHSDRVDASALARCRDGQDAARQRYAETMSRFAR